MTEPREPLHAKYRPQTFADVAGQKPVRAVLYGMCKRGTYPPGMLFSGERGCGKTTMARIVAKALNCEAGPGKAAEWPCNRCASCASVDADSSMAVEELDAASNGTVAEIREIRERAYLGALPGTVKVYIVDEAHGLTGSAFEAVLKLLEEPPPGVLFILCTTQPGKVPATVRSRLSPFTFTPLPANVIRDRLAWICEREGFKAEDGLLAAIAEAARGGMRDAVVRLDQVLCVGITRLSMWQELTGETDFAPGLLLAAAAGNDAAVHGCAEAALSAYGDPARVTRELVACLTDVMVLSCNGAVMAQGGALEARQALCERVGPRRAHAALMALWDLLTKVRPDDRETGFWLALAVIRGRLSAQPEAAPISRDIQPASAAKIKEIMGA